MNKEILLKINGFLDNTGFECIDLLMKGERNNKILEIFVDSREVFDIDKLARLNKEIWEILEKSEMTKDISKVTMSSPGVEKPFKYLWQIHKHIGKLFIIVLKNGNILNGKLLEIKNEREIIFEVLKGKKEKEIINLIFEDIQDLRVKLQF